MALNPNIILSGMPQPFDTNALLQQQISGMENINTLERQRRADELAMQDRAAAAEKEAMQAQEAATLKALLPAYTYGIQTGDMAGALNLVPPEMQESLRPYVDALAGKPPEEVKAALIGSMSTSDIGREALAAIQRAGTLGVQQGQLTLAQQQAEREAAAVGVPKPMTAYETERIKLDREKAEREQAAEEASGGLDPKVKLKLDQSYPQASRALQSSVTNLDSDISDVERLLSDEVGLKAITGALNAATPNIFADATRAQALLDKIMSGAGFSALQAMRDASPTGGALGNVSNQEGSKLEKSVAAFSQAQEYSDFREALRQYLIDLKIARENVQSAFDETYSYRGEVPSAGIVEETTKRRSRIEQETAPATPKTALPPGVTVKRN
jgi:hypothetical protein